MTALPNDVSAHGDRVPHGVRVPRLQPLVPLNGIRVGANFLFGLFGTAVAADKRGSS